MKREQGIRSARHCGAAFAAVLLMGSVLAAPARAALDRVVCVPWQGDPLKFHTAVAGRAVQLKGVIRTTDIGTQFWYKWVFGDGEESPVQGASGSLSHNVAITHIYNGAVGTPFTARLLVDTVDSSMANAVADKYLVKIEEDTLDARVNIAIDNGLWYLHKAQWTNGNVKTLNGQPAAVWSSYGNYFASPTACAVLAFEINSHLETGDANEDPYVVNVQRGLNWLLNGYYGDTGHAMLLAGNIGPQTYGNPDTRANGKGIYVRDWDYTSPYEGGMVMDAIIASHTPGASTGRDFDGDGVAETYWDVIQDMIDLYAWGQYDHATVGGGWRYDWNQHPDNSACQWAAIGMIPAETDWGCTVPQWVKERNNVWLNYSYNATQRMFGYTDTNWGNFNSQGTRPSGMVQMVMSVPNYKTDPRWLGCEAWFTQNWNWFIGNRSYYAWYAFVKAMRLSNTGETLSNGYNWYRDPNGIAQRLLNEQEGDGSWPAGGHTTHPGTYGDVFVTAWAVGMLRPALFAASPVACYSASPNPNYPDYPITFDPRCSGHSQGGKDIRNLTLFEWDFNNDGVYDEATATPEPRTRAFPCPAVPCVYPVTLRVTDDSVPPLAATYTLNVNISNPPHPPVASAGGPYWVSLCGNDSLTLDASKSYDPNEGQHEAGCGACPNDGIVAFDWDLTSPLTGFNDRSGKTVTIDAAAIAGYFTAGPHSIGLRVTDNTKAAYPTSGQNNLTHADFATVEVMPGCVCDLSVASDCESMVLSWTGAAAYDVHRSEQGANTGFSKIGQANGTRFEDRNVTIGKSYYYRVATPNCLSSAVKGTVLANDPPVIDQGNNPLTMKVLTESGCADAENRLQLGAKDPEKGALTWSIKPGTLPAKGMVSFDNGGAGDKTVACYTPRPDQLGGDTFVVVASDPCGKRDEIRVNVTIEPRKAPELVSVVSRRLHRDIGEFDVDLPIDPPFINGVIEAGIESRVGGPQKLIFTFDVPLMPGAGSTNLGPLADGPAPNQKTLLLKEIPDQTCVFILLKDIAGLSGKPMTGLNYMTIGVLACDVSGDGIVASGDITQVKALSGNFPTAATCRRDVNCDGLIGTADITQVKARSGNAMPCPAPAFVNCVSRKSHGVIADFDVEVPLVPPVIDGAPQIPTECRSGGPLRLIFTFNRPVGGGGTTNLGPLTDGPLPNQKTLSLAGVADGSCLKIELMGITDIPGNALVGLNKVALRMLAGDVNGDGVVASADITQIKARSGSPLEIDIFRNDVNNDGIIGSADVTQVKARSGNTTAKCP